SLIGSDCLRRRARRQVPSRVGSNAPNALSCPRLNHALRCRSTFLVSPASRERCFPALPMPRFDVAPLGLALAVAVAGCNVFDPALYQQRIQADAAPAPDGTLAADSDDDVGSDDATTEPDTSADSAAVADTAPMGDSAPAPDLAAPT